MRQASVFFRAKNPLYDANCLSKLTFWYTFKIFRKAWKSELTDDDCTQPMDEHCSSLLGEKMAILWTKELENARKKSKKPRIYRTLFKLFRGSILGFSSAAFVMEMFVRIMLPLFLKLLLRYYSKDNLSKLNSGETSDYTYIMRIFFLYEEQGPISKGEAAFFTFGLVFTSWLTISICHPYLMGVVHLGMKMRIACCSLIYRKALRLRLDLASGNMIGNVVNLLSNDVQRFDNGIMFVPYIWIAPLQIALVTFFLYKEVGIAAVYGIIALVSVLPILLWLALKVLTVRYRSAMKTDERMKEMNELIQAMQVIKMYTWEKIFIDIISENRKQEVFYLKMMGFIKGVVMSFIIFSFRFSIFVTCVTYVFNGGTILAEKVYVITAFLLVLRQTVTVFFPQTLAQGAELLVSFVRIEEFLSLKETKVGDPTPLNPKHEQIEHRHSSSSFEANLIINDASVKLSDTTVLKNISLEVRPGQLTTIIGSVGSGKSCLLYLILGELEQFHGTLDVKGEISLASQEPWLFAGTIRQNILFGERYIKKRYDEVCYVCALSTDFKLMPLGDKTFVGERGTALSGGQRARINLARTVYKDADIYLLDDPLSAVDTNVGQHLFDKCINGYISDKIVVLVTHQLQYLETVDQIVLMKDGEIQALGDYEQLKSAGLDFSALLIEQLMGVEHKIEKLSVSQKKESLHKLMQDMTRKSLEISPIERTTRSSSTLRKEVRSTHNVGFGVYKEYFIAGASYICLIILFTLFLMTQLTASYSDFFIAKWIDNEELKSGGNRPYYLQIYSVLICTIIIVALIRSFHFFHVCMTASKNLHNNMFRSVIETRMYFFITQGSGAILNRFSRDLGVIDELLPNAIMDTIQICLNLCGVIIVLGLINPFFLIPTFLMIALFREMRRKYLTASNNIRRLESTMRNPVYSHINSTLQGLATIRSSGAEQLLTLEFDRHQDMHSSAWYMFISTSRSFGYWLDTICTVYIAGLTYSFMLNESHDSHVGLAITQSLSIVGIFQWGLRQSSEVANSMVSVERVLEFTKLEPEPQLKPDPLFEPPSDWPTSGKIEFTHAYMRYGPQGFHALRDVSFVIQDKEKIGVVGRTGAGKSSLIAALFRLAYFYGDVKIDNLDISKMCLQDLRRRISIIPQEPVLFSGTLQSNLDPFDEYDEDLILKVLIDLENKEALTYGKECLRQMIIEGGINISLGQKQIICLARALLRNNKILVMDEATANIDAKTDKFIQSVIRTKFSQCTVITIAHRLHTIMDSDKVMVMDAGQVAEFDHPHVLLENRESLFTSMVERTGKHMSDNLRKIARENYNKRDTVVE